MQLTSFITGPKSLGLVTYCLFAFFVFESEAIAQTTAAPDNPLRASIARIEANECSVTGPGGDRTVSRKGSGFLWADNTTLVTARHVVSNCNEILVWFPDADAPVIANEEEGSLDNRDIAVLELSEVIAAPPLEYWIGPKQPGSPVSVMGYPLGTPEPEIRAYNIANVGENNSISSVVPISRANQILALGIDLDTKVVRLSNSLLTGHSGAPIIDNITGYVIGVASAGIGTSDSQPVTWGVDAEYLASLRPETDIVSRTQPKPFAQLTYQTGLQGPVPSVLTCGESSFRFLGTSSLTYVYNNVIDNKQAVDQIMQSNFMNESDAASIQLNLWKDDVSGSIISIPASAQFDENYEQGCRFTYGQSDEIHISTRNFDDKFKYQLIQNQNQFSLNFSSNVAETFPRLITPMQGFSWFSPIPRDDGYEYRRSFFGGTESTTRPRVSRASVMLVSEAWKNGNFVVMVVTHKDYESRTDDPQTCQVNMQSPRCIEYLTSNRPSAVAFIAGNLLTFETP